MVTNLRFGGNSEIADGKVGLCLQLSKETAHFVACISGTVFIVDTGDVFGTLDKTIEVVGIDRNLMTDGGQSESLAQRSRNKTALMDVLRQSALFKIEDEHVAEVQTTRLQHAHNLNAHSRFAVEGDVYASQKVAQKTAQGGLFHLQRDVITLDQLEQLLQHPVCLENGFYVELFVKVGTLYSGKVFSHLADKRNQVLQQGLVVPFGILHGIIRINHVVVGVLEQCTQDRTPELFPMGVVPLGLQVYQGCDETVHRRVSQRESHGGIHGFGMSGLSLVRNGMQERQQLGFVTKDNGIVSGYRVQVSLQP